jgi:ABC-type multidrug transport system fused ATPase/permease subunit
MLIKGVISQRAIIRDSYKSLPREARRKLKLITSLGIFSNVFDLFGVALIGVLGAITVSGFGTGEIGSRIQFVLNFLHLSSFSFQTQVAIIGLLAALLLFGRSLVSLFLSRYSMFLLARVSSEMSSALISKLLHSTLSRVQLKSPQQTSFSVTYGVNSIALSIIGNLSIAITDSSLLILLGVALIIVDPILAFASLGFFTLIGIVVSRFTYSRAKQIGDLNSALVIQSDELMLEILTSYREIFVRNRRDFYIDKISSIRRDLSVSSAEMQFMPQLSKYAIELALIIGSLAVSAFQFVTTDAVQAVSTLSIFLVAGARLAPAVIRIQQSVILIRMNTGYAQPTINLISELNSTVNIDTAIQVNPNSEFIPQIKVNDLSYSFIDSENSALERVSFVINPGEKIVIAGPSGSGKSTLFDILLGLRSPNSGSAQISGINPSDALKVYPGRVAYVPQNVIAVKGSIKHNLSLGYNYNEFTDDQYWSALKYAGLLEFVEAQPAKLNALIGHSGVNLSGGQKQRIGIARALLTNPKLLFLDESTSALDQSTEAIILEQLFAADNEMTVVLITHRVAVASKTNRVILMSKGKLIADGPPDQVIKQSWSKRD